MIIFPIENNWSWITIRQLNQEITQCLNITKNVSFQSSNVDFCHFENQNATNFSLKNFVARFARIVEKWDFSVIFEHGVEKTGGKEEQSLKSCFVVILHSRVLQIANLFLKIIKIVAKLTFLARKFDYFASVASQIHFFQKCKQKFT